MPMHVMPEKVKQATQSLDQLIRRHAPSEGRPVDVESYLLLASVLADQLGSEGDRLVMLLREGMEAQVARALATDLVTAADTWFEVARFLQDLAARLIRETGEPIKGMSELASDAARIEELQEVACRVMGALDVAHQLPLDADMLLQAEGDFTAGRFEKGQEVIARLRSRQSP